MKLEHLWSGACLLAIAVTPLARAADRDAMWLENGREGVYVDRQASTDLGGSGVSQPLIAGCTPKAIAEYIGSPVDYVPGAFASEGSNMERTLGGVGGLGHTVTTFTATDGPGVTAALVGQDIVLLPELEDPNSGSNPLFTATGAAAILNFVSNGGTMISVATNWGAANEKELNRIFGWGLTQCLGGPTSPLCATADSCFGAGPLTLPNNNSLRSVCLSSAPAGSSFIYRDSASCAGDSVVTRIAVGSGQVILLGWDWFDAVPTGIQDGGWNEVLDRAACCAASATTTCDLAPIEAKLDDATRFTSDSERISLQTTLVSEIDQNETKIDAIEAKLDDGTRFTSDAERTTLQTTVIGEINANEAKIDAVEAKLDDGTRFTSDAERTTLQTTVIGEINANETKIDAVEAKLDASSTQVSALEAKLDDGTRFTSDAERVALQTAIVAEVNQNETKVDALEVKLDDGTRFTSDAERNALQATIVAEVDVNEAKIDALEAKADSTTVNVAALEAKLDDGSRFTSDAEATAVQTAVVSEIDVNEVKIDALEAKLDSFTLGFNEALCEIIHLLLVKERDRCSDTVSCGFGRWAGGLDMHVPAPACQPSSKSVAGSFTAPTTSVRALAARGAATAGVSEAAGIAALLADARSASQVSEAQLATYISTALRGDEVDPVLVMPAAVGGSFERVADLVRRTFEFYRSGARSRVSGSTVQAEDAMTEAERLRLEGDYVRAYRAYRTAYRHLVTELGSER